MSEKQGWILQIQEEISKFLDKELDVKKLPKGEESFQSVGLDELDQARLIEFLTKRFNVPAMGNEKAWKITHFEHLYEYIWEHVSKRNGFSPSPRMQLAPLEKPPALPSNGVTIPKSKGLSQPSSPSRTLSHSSPPVRSSSFRYRRDSKFPPEEEKDK